MFQFTHPGRGATRVAYKGQKTRDSFNSRTPGGVRLLVCSLMRFQPTFQFTHPGRGATHLAAEGGPAHQRFNSRTPGGVRLARLIALACPVSFNSRTPGGVRHNLQEPLERAQFVSIHAPREGCDLLPASERHVTSPVSIHAPREGCDGGHSILHTLHSQFQFTHPGRGATLLLNGVELSVKVSIHAPREGCDEIPRIVASPASVSIHAPREGCDRIGKRHFSRDVVSIHAPREGCD